ncbi:hypothetical protein D9549_16160, partial [Geobacillus stearothermophilus]
ILKKTFTTKNGDHLALVIICERRIPVRSFSGDLIKKRPRGMMQGCQPHHSPYKGGLQMNW